MRITPRSLVLASAVMVAAAFTAHTAVAETVHVPFDFKVKGKTMPAGEYIVHRNGLNSFVSLEDRQSNMHYTWTLEPGDAAPTSSDVKVSFTKIGDEYELHSIQYHALTAPNIDKHKSEPSTVRVLRGE